MTVWLIRHGKTAGNTHRRYIGTTDEPLCAEGIAQAQQAGRWENVEEVFVSPMRRTRQTAEILFPNARQHQVPELREMDFGAFENQSADDMTEDAAYREWVDGFCLGKCPGGESMAEFSRRVCQGFARVMAEQRQDAYFVVHGGTIMSILERFGRPEKSYFEYHAANCGGFRCTLAPGRGELPFILTDITPIGGEKE